jgi:sortase A
VEVNMTAHRQFLLRATIGGLLLTGSALGAQGSWIYGKAKLAQLLLEMSWRGTLAGRGEIKPWPWADTHPIAKLRIERDGSHIIVLAGASGRTMAFGPGHLDGSAMPGDRGNCVITAHRDTHFAPLRYVMPGDVLALQRADGETARYEVKGIRIVSKWDTSVIAQDERSRLTLITCYPFDAVMSGGPLRYVVMAEKV